MGVFEELCRLLSVGELIVLLPGQSYTHERTAVLLQGSLEPKAEVSTLVISSAGALKAQGSARVTCLA